MAQTSLDHLRQEEEDLLLRTYGRYPIAVARGKGTRLWDYAGREYVDLLSGIAVIALGHCHPEVTEAIARQAGRLVHVSNLFYQQEQLVLARALLDTAHFGKVFFCNSGAEANEAAIKLARRYQQRVRMRDAYEIITFEGAFHGRTLATVAATGQARFSDGFSPLPEGFRQVPWGDLEALEAAVSEKTAGILLEIVQGEGGIRPATPAFAAGVADICARRGVLFLVDEVQCGLGRTGKWWAFQHFGLAPDILSTAKALAGGLPMGAVMSTDEAAAGFAAGSHASTFGGGALVSAAAAKVLEIIARDRLPERAAELGAWAMDRFRASGRACPGCIREVRGLGLMIGIELAVPGKEVWSALLEKGFILNLTQDTILRLLPPLTIEKADLEAFAQALEEVLTRHRQSKGH
ncbi:MAG: aspartate aminotransferase family protein [Desulfovibrio sp.]|jgi:acetylornithine aminotransferase|nr:aspartate aminotransferase family protein [Desulfovibrio sp.]